MAQRLLKAFDSHGRADLVPISEEARLAREHSVRMRCPLDDMHPEITLSGFQANDTIQLVWYLRRGWQGKAQAAGVQVTAACAKESSIIYV